MKIFVKEQLSPHKYKTPQGYLICTDAVLARTGKQTYKKSDFFPDSVDPEANLEVDRPEKEVFSEQAIASFENMPITVEHPYQEVTAENWKEHAVGFVRDVRQGEYDGEKVLLGNLVITDAKTIEEIEAGEHTELSCGYDCDVKDESNPFQENIRGNHLALCAKGRAGIAHIRDSVKDVDPKEGESKEDFISRFMSETKEEYPDEKQRVAVAHSYWEKKHGKDSITKDSARTITVQCYIFSRDGKQLLTQERPGPSWPGLAVPGGHVKADETPLEACVREVREETGLEVRQLRLFGTHQYECEEDGPSIALLFTTTDSYGDLIVESDEGYHKWYTIDEVLRSPKCANGLQSILSKLLDGAFVGDSKVKDYNKSFVITTKRYEDDAIAQGFNVEGYGNTIRVWGPRFKLESWIKSYDADEAIHYSQVKDSVKDADTRTLLYNALNFLKIGFRLLKEGKTWTGRKHFEFETGKVENFRQTMELIDKVIDRFDEAHHCASTYNAVLKSDGTINIVVDVDDKHAHDSIVEAKNVSKLAKITKIASLSKK